VVVVLFDQPVEGSVTQGVKSHYVRRATSSTALSSSIRRIGLGRTQLDRSSSVLEMRGFGLNSEAL
jgi:hypothetical protein